MIVPLVCRAGDTTCASSLLPRYEALRAMPLFADGRPHELTLADVDEAHRLRRAACAHPVVRALRAARRAARWPNGTAVTSSSHAGEAEAAPSAARGARPSPCAVGARAEPTRDDMTTLGYTISR